MSQFALTEDEKLNGVINVYDDRLSFVDAETVAPGAGNFEDTLNFSTTERRERHRIRRPGRDDGRRRGDDRRRFRVG